MHLAHFLNYINGKQWRYRLKIEGIPFMEQWNDWLIQPSPGYLETRRDGPLPIRQVQWIDIDASFEKPTISNNKLKRTVHVSQLKELLQARNIPFAIIDNGVVRVLISGISKKV